MVKAENSTGWFCRFKLWHVRKTRYSFLKVVFKKETIFLSEVKAIYKQTNKQRNYPKCRKCEICALSIKAGILNLNLFFKSLEKSGIRRSDPRLKEMIKNLDEIRRESRIGGIGALSFDYLLLDRNTFKT